VRRTLLMTASWASESRILNQTPMSWQRSATGRRVSQTNLWASRRTSNQLLSRANRGASGNAATNIVMKPNCNTAASAQYEVVSKLRNSSRVQTTDKRIRYRKSKACSAYRVVISAAPSIFHTRMLTKPGKCEAGRGQDRGRKKIIVRPRPEMSHKLYKKA